MPGPTGEECRLCRFFVEAEGTTVGGCKRFPPMRPSSPPSIPASSWPRPIMDQGDWCGEFVRKGERL